MLTQYTLWLIEDIPALTDRDRELLEEEKEIKSLRLKVQEKYKSVPVC